MANVKDDRGFNQRFEEVPSTIIRSERRAERLIKSMECSPEKTVLEIGCGSGRMAHYLAKNTGMKVLGTDLCVPFIDEAKSTYQLSNLSFEVLDFNNPVQVADRKFDYIIGNGILHHLYYNLDAALTTIRSLLTENGKMIFWEPNLYNPYVYLIFSYPSLREKAHLEPDEMAFSKSFIHEKLQKIGYQKIEIQYLDFLLPGVPEIMIKPLIVAGAVAEKIPGVKMVSQSLFIEATK